MSAPAYPAAPDRAKIGRALLSVSDKTGLIEAATALSALGVELVSTGGTRAAIAAAGLPVKDVSELTGFAEMMDGRVKTLHPVVHGGLLGVRDAPEHAKAMADHGIGGIDLLYVNLYPFEATDAGGGDFATCIENIDIGGPAMIRSAAKNHGYVCVCTAPQDMAEVIAAKQEKMLVFSQYAEATEPIAAFLGSIFGREGCVLTGATEVKGRQFVVSRSFSAGFTTALMAKDLRTAGDVANHLKLNMPNLQQAVAYWTAADGKLGKGADHTEIFRYAEMLAEGE